MSLNFHKNLLESKVRSMRRKLSLLFAFFCFDKLQTFVTPNPSSFFLSTQIFCIFSASFGFFPPSFCQKHTLIQMRAQYVFFMCFMDAPFFLRMRAPPSLKRAYTKRNNIKVVHAIILCKFLVARWNFHIDIWEGQETENKLVFFSIFGE